MIEPQDLDAPVVETRDELTVIGTAPDGNAELTVGMNRLLRYFGRYIDRARLYKDRVIPTKYGRPQAVILAYDVYERLRALEEKAKISDAGA